MDFDVIIVGGGPSGSTLGTLLRKYNPLLKVLILEREHFPRDHVGESQLPVVCEILDEMGAWDKVEAANFPVKVGATYRWGLTDDLWDFNFLLKGDFKEEARPAKYEGQRKKTAFQVDRSIYDKILLDHARETGCIVSEGTKVTKIHREGDRILGVEIQGASELLDVAQDRPLTATYYCDCTGDSGLIRRTMDIRVESPTSLRNVAVWDYWRNAEWAVNIGVGGTRIQIMSLGWGWLWFIPVGPDRTSIGLVTPAQFLKQSGKKLHDLYHEAVRSEPVVSRLIANATCEDLQETTKDWSFISDRMYGENWFLAGDAAGFADPILSAGLTLAQSAARRLAFTILELIRGEKNPTWLLREYNDNYRFQIGHHIRFADYWYSANAVFTDLKENCSQIAADAGLDLDADAAFQWLGTGGFARDVTPGVARAAAWNLSNVKHTVQRFSKTLATWKISENNVFKLQLEGAEKEYISLYEAGKVVPIRSYKRGQKQFPMLGLYELLFAVLNKASDLREIVDLVWGVVITDRFGPDHQTIFAAAMEVLEALVTDGWVIASRCESRPYLNVIYAEEGYGMEFVDPQPVAG